MRIAPLERGGPMAGIRAALARPRGARASCDLVYNLRAVFPREIERLWEAHAGKAEHAQTNMPKPIQRWN